MLKLRWNKNSHYDPTSNSAALFWCLGFCFVVMALPASAHSIKEKIADCTCDEACFTKQVENLSCSNSNFSFQSRGLPDPSHQMMTGITGTNQQFPSLHNYQFTLLRSPKLAKRPTQTEPGAVGVAVNGIPIFDPSTQGPVQRNGKPVSAAAAGELDNCGGHAGRGDDYHYHVAPNCLIEDLGRAALETRRQPIGYAADGFPILALGWFEPANDIEAKLDECRGATDASGRYFYNVQHDGDFAVLDCFSGTQQRFARDKWDQRRNADGDKIVGIPIHFEVNGFRREKLGQDICSTMSGVLINEQVLSAGTGVKIAAEPGALFHCNPGCYGHFVDIGGFGRGRTIAFESQTERCPADFPAITNNQFLQYKQ